MERPLEEQVVSNLFALNNLCHAVQRIHTSEKVLRRVAYWDRAYMQVHRCRCGVTWVKGEFGWYRDETVCHCFTERTEYQNQWIALRAHVPAHEIERLIAEVDVLYELAEREYGRAPDLDYMPSAAEAVRIKRRVIPHEQALVDAVLMTV